MKTTAQEQSKGTLAALKAWETRRANQCQKGAKPAPHESDRRLAADLWGRNIADALKQHNGNKLAAARALGIPVFRLTKRIEEYGLHDLVRQQPKLQPKRATEAKPRQMTRAEGMDKLRVIIRAMVAEELDLLFGPQVKKPAQARVMPTQVKPQTQPRGVTDLAAKRSAAANKAWETRRLRAAGMRPN